MLRDNIPILSFHQTALYFGKGTLLVEVLAVFSFRFGLFPFWYDTLSVGAYWMMSIATTLGVLLSLLLHESAHLIVAYFLKVKVPDTQLFLFGDFPARRISESFSSDWRVAFSGPLVSLLLGSLLLYVAVVMDKAGVPGQAVVGIVFHVAAANFTLGLLNLIPLFPFDSGRALLSRRKEGTEEWIRSRRFAIRCGTLLTSLILFVGVVTILRGGILTGLWVIGLGIAIAFVVTKARNITCAGVDQPCRS